MFNQDFLQHLEKIRTDELNTVCSYLSPGQQILEIGGGAGWQAQQLAERGYKVVSIDVISSQYQAQVWQVIPYDGHTIPLTAQCVDVVFSSNVLEHISHVVEYQSEIQRVLKQDGIAIHLMPTPSWRFWTTVTQLLTAIRLGIRNFLRGQWLRLLGSKPRRLLGDIKYFMLNYLRLTRHGEIGNILTEHYYFSRHRWIEVFQSSGWEVKKVVPNQLFYTGYNLLGDSLSMATRHRISRYLGGACHIYILKKT